MIPPILAQSSLSPEAIEAVKSLLIEAGLPMILTLIGGGVAIYLFRFLIKRVDLDRATQKASADSTARLFDELTKDRNAYLQQQRSRDKRMIQFFADQYSVMQTQNTENQKVLQSINTAVEVFARSASFNQTILTRIEGQLGTNSSLITEGNSTTTALYEEAMRFIEQMQIMLHPRDGLTPRIDANLQKMRGEMVVMNTALNKMNAALAKKQTKDIPKVVTDSAQDDLPLN